MNEAEQMMALFLGCEQAFGRTEVLPEIDPAKQGKRKVRSWLDKRPPTVEDWRAHLDGLRGIGIIPLRGDQVRWGAVDIDVYDGLDLLDLNRRIQEARLPLVVCRSKSGGPHLFCFTSEWVPATLMMEKLGSMAAFLGFGQSEIFPKQSSMGRSAGGECDYGNWINMPYFGRERYLRYALDGTGRAITGVPEFVGFCTQRFTSAEGLAKLSFAGAESGADRLPEGPPCLNRLFSPQYKNEYRNISLCNAAVYLKLAFPEGEKWKTELNRVNQMLVVPVDDRELTAVKESYGKKDYKYQCNKEPLCALCDSALCRRRKFGVAAGTASTFAGNRSLTLVKSEPPVWFLDVEGHRVALTTDQLQNSKDFQARIMEELQIVQPVFKREEWEEIVRGLMAHVSVIEIPEEFKPFGQFREALFEFLERAGHEGPEGLLRGVPVTDVNGWHFRLKDLCEYLKHHNRQDKPGQINTWLKDLGGVRGSGHYEKRHINFWTLPKGAIPDTGQISGPAARAENF
jgi:hypothetical protein